MHLLKEHPENHLGQYKCYKDMGEHGKGLRSLGTKLRGFH